MDVMCFCGGSPEIDEWEVGEEILFALRCNRCELRTDWFHSEDEAGDDWIDMQSSIEEHVNRD